MRRDAALYQRAGSGSAEDARSSELRSLFIAQDRELSAERPELVAEKYAAMRASRYAYLRGSAIVLVSDAARYTGHADG